jgi:sugar O-acyltransferase (sialic acid O-acetyltransferase NeuD family)
MNRLLLIGASGFGRELLAWARDVPAALRDWEPAGFLDQNPSALDGFGIALPIVGDPGSYDPRPGDRFVCAIGDPTVKLRLCRALRARGGKFTNLVHPLAHVPAGNRVGVGVIFCPWAALTTHVTIGDFVTFNCHAGAGHDAEVGDGCTFSAYAETTGNSVLGEGVFLGSHAVVLPSVRVGERALIGAGAVVLRNVPAGATMFGNPAKQVAGFA